jgi:cyclopropane-fatty-acyl-phospholipid synthase
MTYSCGIFDSPDATMEMASVAKYDRLCRMIGLEADDHLVEVGCGWGGFAMHAASRYGCRVTGTTISQEQHDLARERIRAAGLEDRIDIVLEDYRDLKGEYDKLVSIEMIEAVGAEFFDTYFEHCSRLLKPHGAMGLQAITILDEHFEDARDTVDFIRRYIFPGGCLPSVGVIHDCVDRMTDMRVVDDFDMTKHYAETLRRWRVRFLENRELIEALGYPEVFQRMWLFYLGYCEGGFEQGRIETHQLVIGKPEFKLPAGR